jgi:hypothetical protein
MVLRFAHSTGGFDMQQHDNLIAGEWKKGDAYSPKLNPSNLIDTIAQAQGTSSKRTAKPVNFFVVGRLRSSPCSSGCGRDCWLPRTRAAKKYKLPSLAGPESS